MSVWPTIERFIRQHGAAVLATLGATRGSTPRETGARMVVRADGSFTGTIASASRRRDRSAAARPGGAHA